MDKLGKLTIYIILGGLIFAIGPFFLGNNIYILPLGIITTPSAFIASLIFTYATIKWFNIDKKIKKMI